VVGGDGEIPVVLVLLYTYVHGGWESEIGYRGTEVAYRYGAVINANGWDLLLIHPELSDGGRASKSFAKTNLWEFLTPAYPSPRPAPLLSCICAVMDWLSK
jgi:hypothetical protein